ncbi:NAD-dependent protein deacylase [Pseudomonas sp. 5P_3.1_Bac2]|uniref:NAD-dependent protein deacylase n=1 Tax=Pseudomonas sp. 5P_3.1_Bac2 TaxID=2971617 RepID=UPI0021C7E687|nr:NAD-dependent protein deacylase [Pseudomonas sp. 5P_3.1_Bac2]MCU1716246.1 NAD-dependent protein deacylase [Pseudomonas sp. 5P_3.1_Bac2]
MQQSLLRVVAQLKRAQRILIITGAGLSADSGLPTYRGLGGLYNGHTAEGLPIEAALSGGMLQSDPALCWKYLAQLAGACLQARPNAAHMAIARLQKLKPECWVLTQNIDGYHRAAGSPAERLIEIHGQLTPLFCLDCAAEDGDLPAHLTAPMPPRCRHCQGLLRPPVVLFGEMLGEDSVARLQGEMAKGFELVICVGTSASFPYIVEPLIRTKQRGGFTVEINPERSAISAQVDIRIGTKALDAIPALVSHL